MLGYEQFVLDTQATNTQVSANNSTWTALLAPSTLRHRRALRLANLDPTNALYVFEQPRGATAPAGAYTTATFAIGVLQSVLLPVNAAFDYYVISTAGTPVCSVTEYT